MVNIGHLRVTTGNHRLNIGQFRLTPCYFIIIRLVNLGHLRVTVGHLRVGRYRLA